MSLEVRVGVELVDTSDGEVVVRVHRATTSIAPNVVEEILGGNLDLHAVKIKGLLEVAVAEVLKEALHQVDEQRDLQKAIIRRQAEKGAGG